MLSRTARISILLVIDVFFFLVEIIVGYAVGSLALVADSFHMLNDVVSLIIALYAIKLTAQSAPSTQYSYGWHRAEILAALVNGVFLLALCFSISLEALQRFFTTPEVSSPKLVVIVGSLGLASNIVGLFLFHEHGHSHSHDQSPSKSLATSRASSVVNVPIEDTHEPIQSPVSFRATQSHHGRERSSSFSSIYGHPAATRASFVQTANDLARGRSPSPIDRRRKRPNALSSPDSNGLKPAVLGESVPDSISETSQATERTPLIQVPHTHVEHPQTSTPASDDWSTASDHHHGHSHGGSMNMKALLLHVLGDALGNVGVIATGLIIWLTSWSFKYYCDPLISLVITAIIFQSALPLVRSTSFILLQGVPSEISLEDVRNAILTVNGVLSVHELHIWQLSESKIIASVHVTASRSVDFMPVAASIRKLLHHHGIHSCTIQPEYHPHAPAIPDELLKVRQVCSSLHTSC
ncbi:cation efflux protein [Auriscalpium vulgare]|uniref:Cation efflux protein n=1 Tax=Auriscalpium vulgare TaxID=40419 RepID=A0ACB8S6H6_9AGAM|nr:cation efflux protein [Auriscalpium vulgare]